MSLKGAVTKHNMPIGACIGSVCQTELKKIMSDRKDAELYHSFIGGMYTGIRI